MTSDTHSAPANRDKSFLAWCAAAVGITFLLQLWLCRALIAGYFPTASELALEVASTDIGGKLNPSVWVTQGFHDYFQIYPEWQVAQTDFWRPLTNALFWLHYQLFRTAWGSQLVFGYLSHAMMVGLTGCVAYRLFHLNRWLVVLAMLIGALNPAYWSANHSYNSFAYNSPPELLQYPVFQTEIACALLMMAACIAFIERRYLLFCACATIALLLKETALTVPVAAMVLAGTWWCADSSRTVRNFAWLVLPLAIWYFGRAFLFSHGNAFYVLSSGRGWLLKPLRNLLYLPSTLYRGPIGVTWDALVTREPHTLLLHGFQLAANALWWSAVFYALYRAWRSAGVRWLSSAPEPWICGLVFALGNICLVMLLQIPDPRFTYFWFALGPAALFAALAHRRHAVALALVLALTVSVPQLLAIHRALSADSIRNYDLAKHSGAALMQLLGKLPASVNTVYLVDDLVAQATAPEFLARFAGFHGRLIIVNSVNPILGCAGSQPQASRYRLSRSAAGIELDYLAPDCFYALKQAPLQLFDERNEVKRGPWMTYHFPQMTVAGAASIGAGANDYDPGHHWTVTVTDPSCVPAGGCLWLGLDPTRQTYYALND